MEHKNHEHEGHAHHKKHDISMDDNAMGCCGGVCSSEQMNEMCGSGKTSTMHRVMIGLLLLTTIFSFMSFWNSSQIGLLSAIEKVDSYKLGGMENYEKFKNIVTSEAGKKRGAAQINGLSQQIQQQFGGVNPEQPTNPVEQPQPQASQFPTGTLPMDVVASLKKNSYVKGEANAKIFWLEFSDLECPFCKRIHDEGTPTKVIEKFGKDVAIIFQHYPLPNHSNAMPSAIATECAGKLGGSKAFYGMIDGIFAKGSPTKDVVASVIKELSLNQEKMDTCIAGNEFTQKIQDQMKFGADTFKIQGTPGNVIINTENGNWTLIAGAYPYSEFERIISEMLAK